MNPTLPLLACLVAACATDADPFGQGEQESGNTCSPYFCGNGNSDIIDNMGLHDLNVNGQVNATGFSLESFGKGGEQYRVRVYGSELTGLDAAGEIALAGSQLVGAVFTVSNTNGLVYDIRIDGMKETEYWATLDGEIQLATTYELVWKSSLSDKYQNLCVDPPPPGHPDLRGNQPRFSAVLFEGDRIDELTKEFAADIDDSWFNIGCMGHALAKLHLTGHTEAAQRQRKFPSKNAERETFLRMIVGDYCRTGTPYTIAGQPLDYMNSAQTLKYIAQNPLSLEARWDEGGATCLNIPRLDANPSPESEVVFPHGVADAMAHADCSLPPPCAGAGVDDLGGGYLNSANPLLP